jgi:hypothetical protein
MGGLHLHFDQYLHLMYRYLFLLEISDSESRSVQLQPVYLNDVYSAALIASVIELVKILFDEVIFRARIMRYWFKKIDKLAQFLCVQSVLHH